ncbi:hypothetical protein GBAR_LOCUS26985 [Geodia barretti]|uniref:Uncharacterized protein n=1 Tax=Geodia barretti TaxID=519541 RepID=A0AA35TJT0_GEOBA|nr:hypothetical protein GBAR_LOCUS26985 [Geodia barretti]
MLTVIESWSCATINVIKNDYITAVGDVGPTVYCSGRKNG